MGILISFNVQGLEWAAEIVKKAADPEKLDRIVNELGETGLDVASSICPVRTGYLKSTIAHVHTSMTSVVSVGARYAIFVEFGTWKMAARPFMRPAYYYVLETARGIQW